MGTAQKTLLIILYALIALMIIFSILAIRNIGQEGYDKCVQQKCEDRGQEYCTKPREMGNCCSGAGGSLGVSDGAYVCVFK